jgi:SPP1 family predicted phage head-tail adaptor
MQAGSLDRRIDLQRRSLTLNAQHENIESFATYATVWASKEDQGSRGREFFAAQQVQAELSTKFVIRHRSDVLLIDRIVCEGITYDVKSVAEIGRRKGLAILATAKVP